MNTVLDQPDDLLSLVGKPLGSTDWMEITQEQVNLFADATGIISGSIPTPRGRSTARSRAPSRTAT